MASGRHPPSQPHDAQHRSSVMRRSPASQSPATESAARTPTSVAGAETSCAGVLQALWHERHNVERLRVAQINPERDFALARMHALLRALGDPHLALRCIHVAGSKGKGSICEMAAAALQGCGYTVGLYTSPHLLDLRERIRVLHRVPDARATHAVHDAWIAPGDAARIGQSVLDAAALVDAQQPQPLSSFELLTALAFTYFAEQAVDAAVIEVGLGGELDATNVITPLVSLLGSIQLEHTQVLGNTLEQIAAHKAGIIKPNTPAFSVPQPGPVEQVFRDRAAAAHAPLKILGQDIEWTSRFQHAGHGSHHKVTVLLESRVYEHVPAPLPGEHQAVNCALVLAGLEALVPAGFELPQASVVEGLARTAHCGRMQLIHAEPRVMVDGAHNPDSIHALVRTLGANVRFDNLVVVFGCNEDKDITGMLEALALAADKIILTKASNSPRAVDPRELLKRLNDVDAHIALTAPSVKDAVNLAAQAVQRSDLILITGSFAIAGEAARLFHEKFATRELKPR